MAFLKSGKLLLSNCHLLQWIMNRGSYAQVRVLVTMTVGGLSLREMEHAPGQDLLMQKMQQLMYYQHTGRLKVGPCTFYLELIGRID